MTERQVATFGGGCFWGVEAGFRKCDGVLETVVGYAGGTMETPTYEDVCSGASGHAEVVRVVFDPARVSYRDLLETFWTIHDPTQRNRQGPDVGAQYRSIILYHTNEQRDEATEVVRALTDCGRFGAAIETEILPVGSFWRAEDYHQNYLEKKGQAVCRIPRET
ncbi:peptide-methionine (S)-S-oxide reductase MsrA [Varunaivibrio sulfuroxidans]|uniref:Peptide methionine sulfoxide reductase MsrA n=1 Tax=Varunaivibrio sulfuroxidans TaxID=1773489 RepID=A0A4R3JCT2_9PROT|nr:peptide-methionine (S)-S-oxide reductase MsrA [Varunaivibrio sulfuroxidans]TCS62490.1 peptide-methionine (S)-S-oxide reductase [Varunaivibrio sulfuroxidans]WES30838.1 peptide-methionine (S)-S-oxide reductase MsrA [Varunaivibrio sulfuroxidans]